MPVSLRRQFVAEQSRCSEVFFPSILLPFFCSQCCFVGAFLAAAFPLLVTTQLSFVMYTAPKKIKKDTVSVLYWYEELSSFDWQFLGRSSEDLFCGRLKNQNR